jgi:hypothetical protein
VGEVPVHIPVHERIFRVADETDTGRGSLVACDLIMT